MDAMSQARTLRADAERNRRRLLDAALEMFSERGLDVGVGEIAARAGVGRGTLFRNFASKEDLIAAIVGERMREAAASGRELLDAPDPDEALFQFLQQMVGQQQSDRALFDAVADTFLANSEIGAAYAELVGVIEQLLARAQEAGTVRADLGAFDLIVMIKGICEAATALQHVNPHIAERQFDLVRAALSPAAATEPLRGDPPTIDDFKRAFPGPEAGTGTGTAKAR
jgi:AcrR family transcriptional regulator